MKAILYVGILLLFVVFITGCTAPVTPQDTATPAIKTPGLVGNWSGTSTGYIGGKGFSDYSGYVITMSVTGQNERVFEGNFVFSNQGGFTKTADFGGVIGRDGRTLTIVERNGGYSFGTIVSGNEIELVHADDTEPSDIAIDSLKKI